MQKVKVHKYAGILSAYGLVLADVVSESQESFLKPLKESFSQIESRFEELKEKCRKHLKSQGFSDEDISFEEILQMRYDRTDAILMCSKEEDSKDHMETFEKSFADQYKREFGFTIPDRTIIVDDIRYFLEFFRKFLFLRVRGSAKRHVLKKNEPEKESHEPPPLKTKTKCYFSVWS